MNSPRRRRRRAGEPPPVCSWWFSDAALREVAEMVTTAESEARNGAAPISPRNEEQENE